MRTGWQLIERRAEFFRGLSGFIFLAIPEFPFVIGHFSLGG